MRPCSKYLANPFNSPIQVTLGKQKNSFSKAIFFDRDGTLNIEKGYITDPSEIELYPDTGIVLRKLKLQRRLIIITTNQSAIGQGLMTVDKFEQVNQALWGRLRKSKSFYDALYYCPHIPDTSCECRKPKPGLIVQAAVDFNIDLSESYMVGDKLSDIEAGKRAGCATILVLTGKGIETADILKRGSVICQPDTIQACLSDALTWIDEKESIIK
jgi:D-glycero-D-manno-heptose 1,7-bisphosphate phosphatase